MAMQRLQRLARRAAQAAPHWASNSRASGSTNSISSHFAPATASFATQATPRTGTSHAKTKTTLATAAAFAGLTASAAAGAAAARCEGESQAPVEGGYKENPLQHVAALLRLYDEIDRNMEVLAGRLLEDLQQRVEKDKSANGGKLSLSPEQIALHMSIEFESALEKVQDAVFRNNYVTKEQVREALQRLMQGELRGSGAQGKLTVQEAEAIEGYVKRIERLRWKVTGSREPIIPTQNKPLAKQDKPKIPLDTVVQIMEKLIPILTAEMETIARDVRAAHSNLSAAQQHQRIATAYVKRSGELTEQICNAQQLDVREFQAALIFYHDDPVFEKALARLSADQQRRFATLGL